MEAISWEYWIFKKFDILTLLFWGLFVKNVYDWDLRDFFQQKKKKFLTKYFYFDRIFEIFELKQVFKFFKQKIPINLIINQFNLQRFAQPKPWHNPQMSLSNFYNLDSPPARPASHTSA